MENNVSGTQCSGLSRPLVEAAMDSGENGTKSE